MRAQTCRTVSCISFGRGWSCNTHFVIRVWGTTIQCSVILSGAVLSKYVRHLSLYIYTHSQLGNWVMAPHTCPDASEAIGLGLSAVYQVLALQTSRLAIRPLSRINHTRGCNNPRDPRWPALSFSSDDMIGRLFPGSSNPRITYPRLT